MYIKGTFSHWIEPLHYYNSHCISLRWLIEDNDTYIVNDSQMYHHSHSWRPGTLLFSQPEASSQPDDAFKIATLIAFLASTLLISHSRAIGWLDIAEPPLRQIAITYCFHAIFSITLKAEFHYDIGFSRDTHIIVEYDIFDYTELFIDINNTAE